MLLFHVFAGFNWNFCIWNRNERHRERETDKETQGQRKRERGGERGKGCLGRPTSFRYLCIGNVREASKQTAIVSQSIPSNQSIDQSISQSVSQEINK